MTWSCRAVLFLSVCVGLVFVGSPLNPRAHELALSTMSDDQFTYFLRKLDTDLARWKVEVSSIDTGALGADDTEQRVLDGHRQLCLGSLEEIEGYVRQLSVQQSLYHDLLLLLELNRLGNSVDQLHTLLTHPSLLEGLTGAERTRRDTYAGQTLQIMKELSDDTDMLHTHVMAFAYQLDRALERGKEKSDQQENQR